MSLRLVRILPLGTTLFSLALTMLDRSVAHTNTAVNVVLLGMIFVLPHL